MVMVVDEKCFESMNRQVRLRPFAAEVQFQDANFSLRDRVRLPSHKVVWGVIRD